MRQLGWLSADSNRFTRIPPEVCSLNALTSLSLLDNPITAIDPFPLDLLNLPKLTNLRISTRIGFHTALLARRVWSVARRYWSHCVACRTESLID
jgi:hypothetical protein